MPFGRDPLTGKNTIDRHSPFASLEAGSRIALPGQDDAYAEFARQGFPPEMYKLAMERTGIDYMVVYPSAGLLTTAVPDLAKLIGLRRIAAPITTGCTIFVPPRKGASSARPL